MSDRGKLVVPSDTSASQALAGNPDYSIWVEANAGSGKTFVLTTRVLRLLLAAFKHRTDAVVQHMPVFLRTTRSLMVCVLSRVDAAGSSAVHQLSRLLAALGDPLHRKLVNKYSPYLLYDYVWVTLVKPLPSAAETVIQAGVWQLMTACSDYEFQQVFASLPSIGKAAFKELHASFTRQFKYTGA